MRNHPIYSDKAISLQLGTPILEGIPARSSPLILETRANHNRPRFSRLRIQCGGKNWPSWSRLDEYDDCRNPSSYRIGR